MVERLKNPIIVSLETHLAGISAQTQKEFDNLEAFRRRFELVLEREGGCRQQARKRIPGPRVGHDNRRSKFRTSALLLSRFRLLPHPDTTLRLSDVTRPPRAWQMRCGPGALRSQPTAV